MGQEVIMVNYVQAQDEGSMVTEKSGKAIKRINYDYDFTRIIKRSNLNYILDTNNKVAKVYQYDQGEKDNPYQYAYTGDINILATITYNKETYSVIAIDEHAFAYCTGLNSVIIPEGVTQIGQYAFKDCSNMTNIILPNNLTNIGEEAFNGCSSLTKINIPKSMTTINKWAFSGCGLTSVDIPDHVMKINDYAFSDCSNLTSVTISEGVTSIGGHAFYNCSSLTNILIPNSVNSIGEGSFSQNYSLVSATIGNGVVNIGPFAFFECSSLTDLVVGSSVTSIEDAAFWGCNALTAVTLNSNPLISASRSTYYSYMESTFGKQVKNYIIGPNVNRIGDGAFYACTLMKSVIIPEGVTSIGEYAFSGCSGLQSITSFIEEPFGCSNSWNYVTKSIPLYVPAGTKEKYKNTDGWNEFTNIIELDDETTGIHNCIQSHKEQTYYSLDGHLQYGKPTKKGVYVVNGKKKIIR
ncbi:MAG: leucine-rich repeat domain-containing protein [Prevotella sp.]|nr:leucine-rich repeat domain-containing protein [Prevotella sp.]